MAYAYRQAAHVLGNEWAERARKLQKKALKHKCEWMIGVFRVNTFWHSLSLF